MLFVVPFLIVAGVIVYQVFLAPSNGTLTVEALAKGEYPQLGVEATVYYNGGEAVETQVTPFTLTVTQGLYVVAYAPAQGYHEVSEKGVEVGAGLHAYAVAEYIPISVEVACNGEVFNNTAAKAIHEVTPVVFANVSSQSIEISGQGLPAGGVTIGPGDNYTQIYSSPGKYVFSLLGTSATGTVTVS